jgi:UDP-4-amino-4-deoxy-L-arabinose formyltransferase/UDP-glucuronic acid dehydrogenase (UDP-4-keto-hexauronic acid decarboxylating)
MTNLDGARQMPRVAAVAKGMGFDVWPAQRVSDPQLADDLRARHIDLLLNAHSLRVVPEGVVDAPSIGAFNLHPGPLPRYAGLNCPSWAIYRGERVYGVTVHRMTSRIDAGAIAYQTSFAIDEEETGFTLSAKCIRAGVPLMLQLVQAARQNPIAIPEVAQDLSQRQYFGREIPRDGALVWSQPAREVDAFIRAADYYPLPSPWRHPRARYAGREIGVVKAARTGIGSRETPGTLRRGSAGGLEVATADEWVALGLVFVGGRYLKAGEALEAGARLEDGEVSIGPAALDRSPDRM